MVLPAAQLSVSAVVKLVLPACAWSLSLVQTGDGATPYSASLPPFTMMPRATPSFVATGAPVSVIVALLTKRCAALPTLSAPLSLMLAAVSATSRSAKVSVP